MMTSNPVLLQEVAKKLLSKLAIYARHHSDSRAPDRGTDLFGSDSRDSAEFLKLLLSAIQTWSKLFGQEFSVYYRTMATLQQEGVTFPGDAAEPARVDIDQLLSDAERLDNVTARRAFTPTSDSAAAGLTERTTVLQSLLQRMAGHAAPVTMQRYQEAYNRVLWSLDQYRKVKTEMAFFSQPVGSGWSDEPFQSPTQELKQEKPMFDFDNDPFEDAEKPLPQSADIDFEKQWMGDDDFFGKSAPAVKSFASTGAKDFGLDFPGTLDKDFAGAATPNFPTAAPKFPIAKDFFEPASHDFPEVAAREFPSPAGKDFPSTVPRPAGKDFPSAVARPAGKDFPSTVAKDFLNSDFPISPPKDFPRDFSSTAAKDFAAEPTGPVVVGKVNYEALATEKSQEVALLQVALKTAEAEKQQLKDENSQLKLAIGERERAMESAQAELQRLSKALADKDVLIAEKERAVQAAASQLSDTERDLAQTIKELNTTKEAVSDLELKLSATEETFGKEMEEIEQRSEKERQAFEGKVAALERTIAQLQDCERQSAAEIEGLRLQQAESAASQPHAGEELRKTNPFEENSFVDEMISELHGVVTEAKATNEVWFQECLTKLQGVLYDSPTLEASFLLAIKENHVALMQVVLKAKSLLSVSEANAVDNPVGRRYADGFTVEMKAPPCPFTLDSGATAKVLIRLQATKAFTDAPMLKVVASGTTAVLKLPITFLRFTKALSESPEALLNSLSACEASRDFAGLSPSFRSLASLGEALSFNGCFHVFKGSQLPSLGRTGLLMCASVVGKPVLCRVTLRPDASGGTVTAMSQSMKLRDEVLRLVTTTVSP